MVLEAKDDEPEQASLAMELRCFAQAYPWWEMLQSLQIHCDFHRSALINSCPVISSGSTPPENLQAFFQSGWKSLWRLFCFPATKMLSKLWRWLCNSITGAQTPQCTYLTPLKTIIKTFMQYRRLVQTNSRVYRFSQPCTLCCFALCDGEPRYQFLEPTQFSLC